MTAGLAQGQQQACGAHVCSSTCSAARTAPAASRATTSVDSGLDPPPLCVCVYSIQLAQRPSFPACMPGSTQQPSHTLKTAAHRSHLLSLTHALCTRTCLHALSPKGVGVVTHCCQGRSFHPRMSHTLTEKGKAYTPSTAFSNLGGGCADVHSHAKKRHSVR